MNATCAVYMSPGGRIGGWSLTPSSHQFHAMAEHQSPVSSVFKGKSGELDMLTVVTKKNLCFI